MFQPCGYRMISSGWYRIMRTVWVGLQAANEGWRITGNQDQIVWRWVIHVALQRTNATVAPGLELATVCVHISLHQTGVKRYRALPSHGSVQSLPRNSATYTLKKGAWHEMVSSIFSIENVYYGLKNDNFLLSANKCEVTGRPQIAQVSWDAAMRHADCPSRHWPSSLHTLSRLPARRDSVQNEERFRLRASLGGQTPKGIGVEMETYRKLRRVMRSLHYARYLVG